TAGGDGARGFRPWSCWRSPHQLDRVAYRVGDRVEVGVADVAPPGIVLEGRVAGRMKSDRHIELLQRAPQELAGLIVQILAVDQIQNTDNPDSTKLLDTSTS